MSMTSPQAKAPAPAMEFQPVADYGLLADCNSAALVEPRRVDRLALPAALRQPGAVRAHPRPRRRATGRSARPATYRRRAPLPARHARDRDDVHDRLRHRAADRRDGVRRGPARSRPRPRRAARAAAPRRGRRAATVELELELAPRPEYGLVRPLFRRTSTTAGARSAGPNQIVGQRRRAHRDRGRRPCAPRFTVVGGRAGRLRAALGRGRGRRARCRCSPERGRRRGSRTPSRAGARGRPSTTSTRARTASSCASARACSRASPTGPPARSSPPPRPRCPRTVGGERNWDYRYAWIRDASLTLRGALHRRLLGRGRGLRLVHDQLGRRPRQGAARCRSCTGSAASTTSPSASCRTCAAGATRARCASATAPGTRRSSTSTASCSTRSHLYREQLGELHPEIQQFVAELADAAARRWQREGRRHVGDARRAAAPPLIEGPVLDRARPRGQARARSSASTPRSTSGRPSATAIREAVLERGWSEKRQAVRAGVRLRRARRRAAADAARSASCRRPTSACARRSTRSRDDLTEDGLVLRYRNEEGLNADGLEGEEGTFVICSFWLVSAPRPGRRDRPRPGAVRPARRLRQRPRAAGRGDRHRARRAARQLPAGVQPHRADHRRPTPSIRRGRGDACTRSPARSWAGP